MTRKPLAYFSHLTNRIENGILVLDSHATNFIGEVVGQNASWARWTDAFKLAMRFVLSPDASPPSRNSGLIKAL
jgi:hypothetical protein